MSIVLVDWLGRGGIAQTSEAWAMELESSGHDVIVVTRADRELALNRRLAGEVTNPGALGGRVAAHRRLALLAERTILDRRASVVVVQNYVIPLVESRVFQAAEAVGARLLFVVHDHRLHSLAAGTQVGLRSLLRRADVVVAHSRFVAERLKGADQRAIELIPHPVAVGMVRSRPEFPAAGAGAPLSAIHFGVLKRSYKGTGLIREIARSGAGGWELTIAGVGAPDRLAGVRTIPGFLPSARLVEEVSRAQATLLPYRFATQSGAVVLAQALGSVPVSSAVGGIPEQIDDGHTGILLGRRAPASRWIEVLRTLADEEVRESIGAAALELAWANHRKFAAEIERLVR